MSSIEVTITGMLYDKLNRTTQNVVLIGEASLTGVGVGGGPIIPPGGSGQPPGIWGGGNVPMPTPPIANVPGAPGWPGGGKPPGSPPGIWGGPIDPYPGHPLPEPPLPPGTEAPEPGDPTTILPGNYPVQPIVPPAYLVVNYPGIGPVIVAPPAETGDGEEQQPPPSSAPKK